jgi:hypothetical protein
MHFGVKWKKQAIPNSRNAIGVSLFCWCFPFLENHSGKEERCYVHKRRVSIIGNIKLQSILPSFEAAQSRKNSNLIGL